MQNETNVPDESKERFWFGHLDDKRGGSIVIWDRHGPIPPAGSVYLYVYRRDTIVQFIAELARKHLHSADNAEIKYLSRNALESYFCALSRYYGEIREQREGREELNPYPEKLAGQECYACGGSGYEREMQQVIAIGCAVCGGSGRT